MWILTGTGNFYFCVYINTFIHKHSFSLPPLDFLIILFSIKTCSLSVKVGFPSEFNISRISDSNFFFLGFTPLCSYTTHCVKWKLRSCAQDKYPYFYHCSQQLSCLNGYSYNFMSTMIVFKEFYEYELITRYTIHIANLITDIVRLHATHLVPTFPTKISIMPFIQQCCGRRIE